MLRILAPTMRSWPVCASIHFLPCGYVFFRTNMSQRYDIGDLRHPVQDCNFDNWLEFNCLYRKTILRCRSQEGVGWGKVPREPARKLEVPLTLVGDHGLRWGKSLCLMKKLRVSLDSWGTLNRIVSRLWRDYSFTRSPYERSVVLTLILSPWLMKSGTMMVAPVSRVASFCAFVDAVSPLTAGSV